MLATAHGQGWPQIGALGLAFVLSTVIGLERELHQKSAGLRTHTLVGVGAALFVLVSKYGFSDVLVAGRVTLDPSRVAAQVVSGIGFIGAGVIFVRRDAVRGLTTAAAVWLTAAVGMAAGAELPVLALAVTVGHFVVVFGYTELARHLPSSRDVPTFIRLTYQGGQGALRSALSHCTRLGWVVLDLGVEFTDERSGNGSPTATVGLQVQGKGSVADLVAELEGLPGVLQVAASQVTE